jgi:hypothetical protein
MGSENILNLCCLRSENNQSQIANRNHPMKLKHILIQVGEKADGQFGLSIMIDGGEWVCDRTCRNYSSESDAVTSARHAINEFRKSSIVNRKS